jgi:hypothetical protein
MKLALDVWYELWEEAGSRGLDTWYALGESGPGRSANHPSGADRDESDSDAGGGG